MITATQGGNMRVSFADLVDLAAEQLGGKVLTANDDFFAPKENLLKAEAPIFIPGKFTENGKWMDGWETRRRRSPQIDQCFDWCIIQLGAPGVIHGFLVDTAFFVGNFPEHCALEGCHSTGTDLEKASWEEIVPKTALKGGTQNYLPSLSRKRFTHIRFKIFPDGGVARLRVFGEVKPDWSALQKEGSRVDLASVTLGAKVVCCNDAFFGQMDNLIMPGRATTMGEGWETRRKRTPGFDWLVLKLAKLGKIEKIEVDTNHFKGNFPESCSIEGCKIPDGKAVTSADFSMNSAELSWKEILPRTQLKAHTQHYFEKELKDPGPFHYVRLNIFPDGGISRLRLFGTPTEGSTHENG